MKAVDHLKDSKNNYGDFRKFLFFSKKYNQAVVFDYRKDKHNPKDKRKHLIATTIFKKGDKYANKETKLVMVEVYSPEFLNLIDSIISQEEQNAENLSEVILEGIEFYFYKGVLNNLPFTEFFEIA